MDHSEDDTKSLFVIIKVSPPFDFVYYSCEVALAFRPGAALALWKVSPCPSPVRPPSVPQIISDLMFFRGTHKKEFDSRWKSFTLVKKSMENRVS